MVFKKGIATFTLGDGDFCTAKGIPIGTKFKVEELNASESGFTVVSKVYEVEEPTVGGAEYKGQIIQYKGDDVATIVSFTNTRGNETSYTPHVTKVLRQIGGDGTAPVHWRKDLPSS